MNCPECDSPETKSTGAGTDKASMIERRRICKRCEYEWRTLEVDAELVELMASALMRQ